MPLTLAQGSAPGAWGVADTGTGTAPVAVTWNGGRTAGSLLVVVVNSDSTESTPTGWNLRQSSVQNSACYLFDRISNNTSTDAPTFSSAFVKAVAWAEYTGNTATPWDAGTSAGSSSTNGSAQSTGTTGATAQADELAVAAWGSWSGSTPGKSFGSETNSFAEVAETVCGTGGEFLGLTVATKALSATGTQESTATPSAACSKACVIQTYKAAAAGGVTVTPGAAALTLTAFAPTVLTPRVVKPGAAALTLTRFAPAVLAPRTVVPPTRALTLATFAPAVSASNARVVTPGTAALVLSAFPPTVTAGGAVVVPAAGDVRAGVVFDAGNLPAAGDVRAGVVYG